MCRKHKVSGLVVFPNEHCIAFPQLLLAGIEVLKGLTLCQSLSHCTLGGDIHHFPLTHWPLITHHFLLPLKRRQSGPIFLRVVVI